METANALDPATLELSLSRTTDTRTTDTRTTDAATTPPPTTPPPTTEAPAGGGLSERDREILSFERQWWRYAGAKEQAIRELFGMSATRYYQILNALIDCPEALGYDPMLVKRLRRLRTARQRARSARRMGQDA